MHELSVRDTVTTSNVIPMSETGIRDGVVLDKLLATQDYLVSLNNDEEWEMSKKHFHESYEILLCVEGGCNFFVGKRLYHVVPGTLLMIAPATLHHSVAAGDRSYVRYLLHITEHFLRQLSTAQTNLQQSIDGHIVVQLDGQSTTTLSSLLDVCRDEDTGFGADLRKQNALVEFLLRALELSATAPVPRAEINKNFGRIMPILDYIENHISGDLSLGALSQEFFVSRQHLCRIFKAETGFSVKEYVSRIRILHACSLLRDGASVQEAGEKSGFSNNTHFIRMFGQIMGQSPGKYAREYRDARKV